MREQVLIDEAKPGPGAVQRRLDVTLFDGFAVSVGGAQVPSSAWRTQKGRSLVKILALAPAHRLHREQIIDALWPDLDPARALNNWRSTLHSARAALEPGRPAGSSTYLVLEHDMLRLEAPDGLRIDVDAFRNDAAACRRRGTVGAYARALSHYRGDLLPEDRYEDWAIASREALRETWLSLIVELGALHEDREEWAAGVAVLERATAAAPTHEDAHSGLMRIHARAGRPGQAMRQYDRLCEALGRELDVEPMPATRRLRADIASGRFGASRWWSASVEDPAPNHPGELVPSDRLTAQDGTTAVSTSLSASRCPSAPAPRPLTCREREVAVLIADGLTNAVIADRLGIARRTVDTHVISVLRKLGVTSRRDVGAALLRGPAAQTQTQTQTHTHT